MSNYDYRPQPAWIDGRTAETAERERSFIRSVYGWMFGGLLITAAAALWVAYSTGMQQLIFGTPLRWILMFAELGLVFWLSLRVTRMSAAAAASMFFVFALLNGLTLSAVLLVYSPWVVAKAFVSAGAMFGAMSIYGMVTKRDLTSWGSFFFMGLIGLLICSVVNIFLRSSALEFAISAIGVFVFLGLTAWDTQKLKAYATAPQLRENLAVYGALALYLDFINLFLMLLRLFGGGNRR